MRQQAPPGLAGLARDNRANTGRTGLSNRRNVPSRCKRILCLESPERASAGRDHADDTRLAPPSSSPTYIQLARRPGASRN
ncbi:hypothetical protein QFZ79_001411 [Arthrobacter sp. V4I6]|nr:hypothetical protein [Arthrobacter sp. V1I7]MDQ0853300.1 hypothetical protein [Arthrobacter sp. V4I6]